MVLLQLAKVALGKATERHRTANNNRKLLDDLWTVPSSATKVIFRTVIIHELYSDTHEVLLF